MATLHHFCVLTLLLVGIVALRRGGMTWHPNADMTNKIVDPSTIEDNDPDAHMYKDSDLPRPMAKKRFITTHVNDNNVASKVNFFYYTRQNPYNPQELRPGVVNALFKRNINKPVKLVIHGYWHSSENKMTIDLRKKLLEVMDVNVIAVDWNSISRQFWYYNVVDNTIFVGRYVAKLLDWLMAQGVNPTDIHIMGHSLGAHVSGFAGSFTTKGKIGRITGLDPALPGFINVPTNKRLDPSDAQFVDCLHTCGGILGIMDPICHADFYVNGGRNLQPGCLITDIAGVCSHLRAPKYFTESIDPKYKFQSALCPEIPFNGPVNCVWTEHFMGFYLKPSANGLFYVQTNIRPPYSQV